MIYHQILLQFKIKKSSWHTVPNSKYSAYHCMCKCCCSRPLRRLYHHEVLPLCHSGEALGKWPFGDLQIPLAWNGVSYVTPHITTWTRAFLGTLWNKTHKDAHKPTTRHTVDKILHTISTTDPSRIYYRSSAIVNNARAESNNWQIWDCIYFLYKNDRWTHKQQ